MSEMKELLLTEWEKEKSILNGLDVTDKEDNNAYSRQVERVEHLEKLLVDLDKKELDIDAEAAKVDIDESIKGRQLEADKKAQKHRNIIEACKIGVPVVAAFAMGIISMKWEKLDTITSTAGKSALREILRFKS